MKLLGPLAENKWLLAHEEHVLFSITTSCLLCLSLLLSSCKHHRCSLCSEPSCMPMVAFVLQRCFTRSCCEASSEHQCSSLMSPQLVYRLVTTCQVAIKSNFHSCFSQLVAFCLISDWQDCKPLLFRSGKLTCVPSLCYSRFVTFLPCSLPPLSLSFPLLLLLFSPLLLPPLPPLPLLPSLFPLPLLPSLFSPPLTSSLHLIPAPPSPYLPSLSSPSSPSLFILSSPTSPFLSTQHTFPVCNRRQPSVHHEHPPGTVLRSPGHHSGHMLWSTVVHTVAGTSRSAVLPHTKVLPKNVKVRVKEASLISGHSLSCPCLPTMHC